MHLKPLAQQRIVITGASSGIGLATARLAAKAGAKVMLAARNGDALRDIVDEIRLAGGIAAFCVTDVSREDEVEALAAATVAEFGGFDSWVNNAGIGLTTTLDQVSTEDHHRLFEVNYFGLVYGSLAAVRHFRDVEQPGALINLGSAASDLPIAFEVPYAATKHAIKGFTDGLRIETVREGLPVSITLIKPSAVDTPFFDHAKSNMGGLGKAPGPQYAPDVVARAILYAAAHQKRDIAVGLSAVGGGPLSGLAPGFGDAAEAAMPIEQFVDFGEQPGEPSLYLLAEDGRERSRTGHGRHFSLTTAAQTQGPWTWFLLGAAAGGVALAATRRR